MKMMGNVMAGSMVDVNGDETLWLSCVCNWP